MTVEAVLASCSHANLRDRFPAQVVLEFCSLSQSMMCSFVDWISFSGACLRKSG